jgi:hypothetical protein
LAIVRLLAERAIVVVEHLESLAKFSERLSKRVRPPHDAGMSMPARKRKAKAPFYVSKDFARYCRVRQILAQSPAQRSDQRRIRWRRKRVGQEVADPQIGKACQVAKGQGDCRRDLMVRFQG